MSGLIIKYKETTGGLDNSFQYEPWFPLIEAHTWNPETYEGTITLKDGVTELPAEYDGQTCTYFNGMDSLTEIEFPEGLTAIRAESAVSWLGYLEKLIVPDTIEYLGAWFGSTNASEQFEDPKMDLVLPTYLNREYYGYNKPELFGNTPYKTITFNQPHDYQYHDYGYYGYFLIDFQIKDAIYINCSPKNFKDYGQEVPQFIMFNAIDMEKGINVYVAEEYYDLYDFDTFFSPDQHEQIANIIKYNPSPEPPTPTKKTGFNLDNMQDKDYTIEIWDRTDRR